MKKILICYWFEKMDPKKRKQFHRRMFGTIEKSHGGRYTTRCKGILTDVEYQKPVRSVIIVDKEYKALIIELLKEYSAKIMVFKIIQQKEL